LSKVDVEVAAEDGEPLLAPANPTGNPNFNLKKRPEVNKSGPVNKIFKIFKIRRLLG
jgi:hypothetical protein